MSPDHKLFEAKRQDFISNQLRRKAEQEAPREKLIDAERIAGWQRVLAKHLASNPRDASRLEQIAVSTRREFSGDEMLTARVLEAQLRGINIDPTVV